MMMTLNRKENDFLGNSDTHNLNFQELANSNDGDEIETEINVIKADKHNLS